MIIIDKLCYRSKLRYVSAAEKLLYAVSSLMICVLTRSYAAALIVFIANGILTVGKGKIPLSCYVRLLMIPIVFLIVGTGAVFLNLSKVPMDAFAVPVGEIYIGFLGSQFMYHGAGGSDMSLFSVVEHNDDRYTGSAQENAYAEASD